MTNTTALLQSGLQAACLVLLACGRLGYDATDNSAVEDAASPADDASVAQHAQLLPGWTVKVWRDFSEQVDYNAQDLIDGDQIFGNAPGGLFLLSPPFEDGFGVFFGRELLQLPAEGTSTLRDYRPAAVNGSALPDHMTDALQVSPWRGTENSILITSTSDKGGDGVYQIALDWSMSRAQNYNNVRTVAFDPNGNFDDLGQPEVYYGAMDGLQRFAEPNPVEIAVGDAVRIAFEPGNRLLVVRRFSDLGTMTASSIESGTHNEALWYDAPGNNLQIVRGTVAQASATFIRDRNELVELSQSSPEQVIASSSDPDWRWMAALKVSTGPLAFDGFYLLEHNPGLDLERILLLSPPTP